MVEVHLIFSDLPITGKVTSRVVGDQTQDYEKESRAIFEGLVAVA